MNALQYKVTFIIPYSGSKAPQYLPLFLNSCKNNLQYRFLFFTDLQIKSGLPPNVEIIPFTKEQLEQLIFNNTGIKANLERFYKICDFKPVFGEIFKDYIYTPFWGHTDVDLILGDLNYFLSPILNDYDVFSFREEYHTGSFAIYRNIPVVNNLYKRVKGWRETLSHPVHFAFDEVSRFKTRKGNIYKYLLSGEKITDVDTEVESFTHLTKDNKRCADIRLYYNTMIKEGIGQGEMLQVSDGKVISSNKSGRSMEYLLYHFILEKAVNGFSYPHWKSIQDEYFITRYGFHKWKNLVPVEKTWRKISLYFTVYPAKITKKIKQTLNKRVSIHGASV